MPPEHSARPDPLSLFATLLTQLHRLVDSARGDAVAGLFLTDATLKTPQQTLIGRNAIHAFYRDLFTGRPPYTTHHWTNMLSERVGIDDHRVFTNSLVIVRDDKGGAILRTGTATDRIRILGGQPRFAARTLEAGFDAVLTPAG